MTRDKTHPVQLCIENQHFGYKITADFILTKINLPENEEKATCERKESIYGDRFRQVPLISRKSGPVCGSGSADVV